MESILPHFHSGSSFSPTSTRSEYTPQDIPSDFHIMDISEDMKFMAIIDSDFTLHVYGIIWDKGVIKPTSYWNRDISIKYSCDHSVFIFLSVASKTGYAAVSFAQSNAGSGLFSEIMLDSNYKKCGIYKGNGQNDATYIQFQGRAVFTRDRLALVGYQELTILDPSTLNRMYFLNLSELIQDCKENIIIKSLAKNTTWAKFYPAQENLPYELQKRKYGDILISLTQHIRSNILVVTHKDYITKVWSILDGSLVTSFKTVEGEQIMAVSQDDQYFATYNDLTKNILVYCTKRNIILHKYARKPARDEIINAAKLYKSQHYLLISGTTGDSKVFFEAWSISCENYLSYQEIDLGREVSSNKANSEQRIILPFIIEIPTKSSQYFTTKFHGISIAIEGSNRSTIIFNKIPILDEESVNFENGYLWYTYPFKRISNKSVKIDRNNADISEPLDNKNKLITYLIDSGDENFILRFSINMVQLWKLNLIDSGNHGIEGFFDSTPEKINRDQVQIQDQEEDRNLKKYHNSIRHSTLLYIRSFKGHNYIPFSTFRDNWEIESVSTPYFNPRVYFMRDKGRILIDITHNGQTTRDEIFLPLPGVDSHVLNASESSNDISNPISPAFYHRIESFSQALHYLYVLFKKKEVYLSPDSEELKQCNFFFNKTLALLRSALSEGNIMVYFNTEQGSKTLAMLASFPHGQNIIVDAIKSNNFDVPLRITSYPVSEEQKKSCSISEKKRESALTVLIKEERYDLFQLLFNISILDHHVHGSADLFSLIDSFEYLKEKELPELLLKCIQTLSYLPADLITARLLNSENRWRNSHTNLNSFTPRCLEKYHSRNLAYYFRRIKKWHSQHDQNIRNGRINSRFIRPSCVCIAPLSNNDIFKIIAYASSAEDGIRKIDFDEEYTMVEAIINYKWRNYAQIPFYFTLIIQILYYIFYSTAISFPQELFGYIPGTEITNREHWNCIILTIITGVYLFILEISQFTTSKILYFTSLYNYIDIATFVLPIVTFYLLRINHTYLYEFSSVTSLVLCIHLILFLRVLRSFGILLQIIIQLTKEVFTTLLVMAMLVISFSISLAILLRQQDNSFFQERFEGNITTTNESNALNQTNIVLNDQSQQNLFTDPFFAFTSVWFFMYGVFDPVFSGDVGNYKMALVLIVLFSLLTALILLNVVIAIMNGSIEKTIEKGNKMWYIHFIAVINEIEVFWGRVMGHYNPPFIFYNVKYGDVQFQYESIKEETEKLLSRRDLTRKTAF